MRFGIRRLRGRTGTSCWGLYGVIKDSDAHIRFTLLTGVSKFSKVNLFSGLNNLLDITLEPEFSSICGYTEADLDAVFAPELPGLGREAIRDWYNGYNWLGHESVYNPFGVLLLFRRRRFAAYWFETATPRFLVDTLMERGGAGLPARRAGGERGAPFIVRGGGHRPGGAALPGRVPDDPRSGGPRGEMSYRLGFPNRRCGRV